MGKKYTVFSLLHVNSIILVPVTAIISSALTYIVVTSHPVYSLQQKNNTVLVFPLLQSYATLLDQEVVYREQDNLLDRDIRGNFHVIFHGQRDKKQIALTFDAEMTEGMKANLLLGSVKSSYNKIIIDILNQTQTKATLFLTGMWIELYPNETKELAQNSLFELANHSYADTSYDGYCFGLKKITDTQALEEVEVTQKLLRDVAGVENHYFRFPGGCYSQNDLDIVSNKAGLQIVHWDVNGADGFNNNAYLIENAIINNTQNGSIIILHLNGAPTAPKTAEALPKIISTLKEKGFTFVKVSELLKN